jgi:hypothetical protein
MTNPSRLMSNGMLTPDDDSAVMFVKPAMPVVIKKGSDYVGAAVKAKPSKADDEGFALDTSDKVSDMKAVSDLDRFDDGNISE